MELSPEQRKELEVVERFHIELKKIDKEVRKIIVGQKEVVDQVMMSLLTGGNSIITGVPGLAKTLLIATVARVLHLDFKRIQFTPDLRRQRVQPPNGLQPTVVLLEVGQFLATVRAA